MIGGSGREICRAYLAGEVIKPSSPAAVIKDQLNVYVSAVVFGMKSILPLAV